jgi:hypothetical protein
VGVLNLKEGRLDLAVIFLASSLYLAVLALPFLLDRSEWGWFHPVTFFPLWTLVTGALPSLGVYIGGLEHHSALSGMDIEGLNSLVVEALLLQSVGWMAFYAGAKTSSVRTLRVGGWEFRGKRVGAKVTIIAGVSVLAFGMFVRTAGGLEELLLQRGRPEVNIAEELGGVWVLLAQTLLPMTSLVWLSLRPHVVRNPAFWLVFCGGLLMGFAATGARSGVIVPMVMALVIYTLQRERIPYGGVMAIMAAALIILGIGGEFRQQSWEAEGLGEIEVKSRAVGAGIRGFTESMRGRGEESPLIGVLGSVPGEVPLLYGRSYLSVVVAPIPSRLWPDKPKAGGKLSGELIFGRPEGGGGMPPGTVGEAFWNFHLPGIIFVYLLWGRFATWLAGFYRVNYRHNAMMPLYAITIIAFAPNTVSFYGWLHYIAAAVIAVAVLCWTPGVPRLRRERVKILT